MNENIIDAAEVKNNVSGKYKIESKHVHLYYGDFHALKNINIAI